MTQGWNTIDTKKISIYLRSYILYMKIQNHVGTYRLPVLKSSRSTLFLYILLWTFIQSDSPTMLTPLLSFHNICIQILISGTFLDYIFRWVKKITYTLLYRYHLRSGMTWGDTNFFFKWEPILFHCKILSKYMISLKMLIQLYQNSDQCIYYSVCIINVFVVSIMENNL